MGDTPIFVFGSNLAGIHGAGAAAYALKHHGAEMYAGVGHHGSSYALPTKDFNIKTMPLKVIQSWVQNFLDYANYNNNLEFNVTKVGCGLAGLKESEITPIFKDAPSNCHLPKGWRAANDEEEDGSEWSSIDR